MDIPSLFNKFSHIVINYALHQQSRWDSALDLGFKIEQFNQMNCDEKLIELRRIKDLAMTRYRNREDELNLLLDVMRKLADVDKYIHQEGVTEEQARPVYAELKGDIDNLYDAFNKMLRSSSTESKNFEFKHYQADSKTFYVIKAFYKECRFILGTVPDETQFATKVKEQMNAISIYKDSPMDSLTIALRVKENARLKAENARLEAENARLKATALVVGSDKLAALKTLQANQHNPTFIAEIIAALEARQQHTASADAAAGAGALSP